MSILGEILSMIKENSWVFAAISATVSVLVLLQIQKKIRNILRERREAELMKNLEKLLNTSLKKYFEDINNSMTPADRNGAVLELKLYLDGIKTLYHMSNDVFDVYISDVIVESKYLDPNKWIEERLNNMSGLALKTQQALFDFGFLVLKSGLKHIQPKK
jgi:hypothetical protein